MKDFVLDPAHLTDAIGNGLSKFGELTAGTLQVPYLGGALGKRVVTSLAVILMEDRIKQHLSWYNGALMFDQKWLHAPEVEYVHGERVELPISPAAKALLDKSIVSFDDALARICPWYSDSQIDLMTSPITRQQITEAKQLVEQRQLELAAIDELAKERPELIADIRASLGLQLKIDKDRYDTLLATGVSTFSGSIEGKLFWFRNMDHYHSYLFTAYFLPKMQEVADMYLSPILDGDKWAYWTQAQCRDLMVAYKYKGDFLRIRALELIEDGHGDLFFEK